MKRPRVQKCRRALAGRCTFCPETAESALDAHRLVPGGRYTWHNILVLCAACHRKVHAGDIAVLGRHPTSSGRYVVRTVIGGEERLVYEPIYGS